MALFRNTDVSARVWPHLSHEGRTLFLDADETADLDLPAGFEDAWLKPVEPEPAEPEAKSRRAAPKAEPTDATDVADKEE